MGLFHCTHAKLTAFDFTCTHLHSTHLLQEHKPKASASSSLECLCALCVLGDLVFILSFHPPILSDPSSPMTLRFLWSAWDAHGIVLRYSYADLVTKINNARERKKKRSLCRSMYQNTAIAIARDLGLSWRSLRPGRPVAFHLYREFPYAGFSSPVSQHRIHPVVTGGRYDTKLGMENTHLILLDFAGRPNVFGEYFCVQGGALFQMRWISGHVGRLKWFAGLSCPNAIFLPLWTVTDPFLLLYFLTSVCPQWFIRKVCQEYLLLHCMCAPGYKAQSAKTMQSSSHCIMQKVE